MAYVSCGDGFERAIPVVVTRKRVKNLNLRVRRDGSVVLSVPWHVSRERAQAFLDEREPWLRSTIERADKGPRGRAGPGETGRAGASRRTRSGAGR